MRSLTPHLLASSCALALLAWFSSPSTAQESPATNVVTGAEADSAPDATADTAAQLLDGAEPVGQGRLQVWTKDGRVILGVPPDLLDEPFHWYVEVVGLPAGVVAEQIEAGDLIARFERQGDRLFIRDLSASSTIRVGTEPEVPSLPDPGDPAVGMHVGDEPGGMLSGLAGEDGAPAEPPSIDPHSLPISEALALTETGAILAALPIAAEQADGTALVDVTDLFTSDVGGLSAARYAALTGLVPNGVDPSRSYLEAVRVNGDALTIRSGLTFLGVDAANPTGTPRPVSMDVGHTIHILPEMPMEPRLFDPRVGFFEVAFTEFEAASGAAVDAGALIARHRLVKADPSAAISDPVEPITFWIGPGTPERWRPAMRAAVEMWLPAFEAAGFSNALQVLEAPSPEEDPDWAVEDATRHVIRWLPSRYPNAMGPHVVDPRTGEILASHIIIWPDVVEYFSLYYYSVFGGVDPRAASLPLPFDLQSELLTYIVGHEVGHALGLRHNQMASTAWSVDQMRDPAFANRMGPNSSLMAYGRFNQVAQPDDGITQFWSVIGPYDFAAIRWGYGEFADQAALDAFAATFDEDRALHWGAGEMIPELARDSFDPRVQRENSGAERIEATQLATANTIRALERLPEAASDEATFQQAFLVSLKTHAGYVSSVQSLVAGTEHVFDPGEGPLVARVPAEEQAEAVAYLLGEGAATFDAYRDPVLIERLAVVGGARMVDEAQAKLVSDLLVGGRLAILDSQADLYPGAYGPADLGQDVMDAVWDDLGATSRTSRVLQAAWVDTHLASATAWAQADAIEAAGLEQTRAAGMADAAGMILVETGDDTVYPAWLRDALPELRERLRGAATAAADDTDRLHYEDMAASIERLMGALG